MTSSGPTQHHLDKHFCFFSFVRKQNLTTWCISFWNLLFVIITALLVGQALLPLRQTDVNCIVVQLIKFFININILVILVHGDVDVGRLVGNFAWNSAFLTNLASRNALGATQIPGIDNAVRRSDKRMPALNAAMWNSFWFWVTINLRSNNDLWSHILKLFLGWRQLRIMAATSSGELIARSVSLKTALLKASLIILPRESDSFFPSPTSK